MKYLNFHLIVIISFLAVIGVQAAEVHPDEFDGPGIQASFEWQKEPPTWDVGKTTPGWLHIAGTFGGNLWCTDDATRLYQEIKDEDFEIETHLKYFWTADNVAGLVVKSPGSDNWVMLKLWSHADKTAQLQFQKKCLEAGDGLSGKVPGFAPANGEAELWLKLKRVGQECTGFFKVSEGDDWTETGKTTFPFSAPYQVGLFGWNNTLEFDYFRDNTSPFTMAVSPKTKLATTWANIRNQ